MSEYTEAKRHFYADTVLYGIRDIEDLQRVYPRGFSVPERYLRRWLQQLHAHTGQPPIAQRLVNRFKLGADPEFVFVDNEGRRVDATLAGLKTGQAYGADLNGRLVEVRPHATRSSLRMVASVLEELRWLVLLHPETRVWSWVCGAYLFRDGLGGHVHLGRKRPQRTAEVTALDNLTEMALALGIYPKDQNDRRRAGDHFGQQYGKPGDIRMQTHGYEYRVFPSWLDSPWVAFLQVTLAKLAVYDPDLFQWFSKQSTQVLRQRLINALAYFKGRDDDAWLAYEAFVRHGLPAHDGTDFKPRWGLMYPLHRTRPAVTVVPPAIVPSAETVQELYDYLLKGTPLPVRTPTPNWVPTTLPPGYYMPIDTMETAHVYGMGELLWDVVGHVNSKVTFGPLDTRELFRVDTAFARTLVPDWQERIRKVIPGAVISVASDGDRHLRIGLVWRQAGQVNLTRKALLSGAFPLWKVWAVEPKCIEVWREQKAAVVQQPLKVQADSTLLIERTL
jgi:hypothetical protein